MNAHVERLLARVASQSTGNDVTAVERERLFHIAQFVTSEKLIPSAEDVKCHFVMFGCSATKATALTDQFTEFCEVIESQRAPQLPARVEALLVDLATTCAKVALQQEDWQKLYEVCLQAHRHGGIPDLPTFKAYLIANGCSKAKAGFLGRQFGHLTEILRLYDAGGGKTGKL